MIFLINENLTGSGDLGNVVTFNDNFILNIFLSDDFDSFRHIDFSGELFSQEVLDFNIGAILGNIDVDGEMSISESHLVSVSLILLFIIIIPRTLITPLIIFLMWEATVVTQVFCFLLANHIWSLRTFFAFLPAPVWISKGRCLKVLLRVPLGPLTVTSLDLKLTVTKGVNGQTNIQLPPSGISTSSWVRIVFIRYSLAYLILFTWDLSIWDWNAHFTNKINSIEEAQKGVENSLIRQFIFKTASSSPHLWTSPWLKQPTPTLYPNSPWN